LAHKVWDGRHLTREQIESFLEEAKTARFCSLNNDGTIHAAPVWFKYENGKIVILTPAHSCKARNAKHNKNVSILIDVEEPTRGVLIYGTTELARWIMNLNWSLRLSQCARNTSQKKKPNALPFTSSLS